MTRRIFLAACGLVISSFAAAQIASNAISPDYKFYSKIEGDSVRIFCSANYTVTLPQCLDFYRIVRMDKDLKFNGPFSDFFHGMRIPVVTGRYKEGKKDGYFVSRYLNGTIESKGNFVNDIPAGKWMFYYPNGVPEREVVFTGTDTLLMKSWNDKGTVEVENGNGKFYGNVNSLIRSEVNDLQPLIGQGKVKNGKPDGKWMVTLQYSSVLSFNWYREFWKNGKMVWQKKLAAGIYLWKTDSDHQGNTNKIINYKATIQPAPMKRNRSNINYSRVIPYKREAHISLFSQPPYVMLEKLKLELCNPTVVAN